jgi:hypothetical protein
MSCEEKMKKFYKKKIPERGINFKAIDNKMTIMDFKKKFTRNKKL